MTDNRGSARFKTLDAQRAMRWKKNSQHSILYSFQMPKPELEFTPVSSFVQDGPPSLLTQTLSKDAVTGDSTVVLTHAPGSTWGEPVCKHDYWEECYILQGRLYDQTLGKWFEAGSYCCRPPGMLHGPYRADELHGTKEICFSRYPRRDESVA